MSTRYASHHPIFQLQQSRVKHTHTERKNLKRMRLSATENTQETGSLKTKCSEWKNGSTDLATKSAERKQLRNADLDN